MSGLRSQRGPRLRIFGTRRRSGLASTSWPCGLWVPRIWLTSTLSLDILRLRSWCIVLGSTLLTRLDCFKEPNGMGCCEELRFGCEGPNFWEGWCNIEPCDTLMHGWEAVQNWQFWVSAENLLLPCCPCWTTTKQISHVLQA